jgi:chromosome segregation ATPase
MKHPIPLPPGIISQREIAVRNTEKQLQHIYEKQSALTELMQPLTNALETLDRDSFMPTTEKTPQMAAMHAELDEKKAAWRLLRQERERLECALVFQKDDLRHAQTRANYLHREITRRQGIMKKTNGPLSAVETYISPETKSFINMQGSGELAKLQRELAALEGEDELIPPEAA